MGCNLTKDAKQVSEIKPITQNNGSDIPESSGKNYVVFDIQLDSRTTGGDMKDENSSAPKQEIRKPVRLAPLSNPPLLTTEMIEEKLKKAEEKREQLLAARRLSCHKNKLPPALLMQGKTPFNENEFKNSDKSNSWILNWSGDEALTDEQLDAILQAEEDSQRHLQDDDRFQIKQYAKFQNLEDFM